MESQNAFKVRDITRVLEEWAPTVLQESYDNSGLLVGDLSAKVTKVLISLDCTEEVVAEAEREGAELIVSHHPIIFSGLKRLTGNTHVERTVLRAIKSGIALYAIHTNLDNVASGVNFELATALGCTPESLKILRPKSESLHQVTVYCPSAYADKVRDAMFKAGAGSIGDYDRCSFNLVGEGTFRPGSDSMPFIGEKGQDHSEPETKIELLVEKRLSRSVVEAAANVHPYEEMAYFITPLENKDENILSHIAPSDLRSFGLIPELVGRFPVLTHLNTLDGQALRRILSEPKNAIIKQYIHLFSLDNIELKFKADALDWIVEQALKFKLGARGLRGILETVLTDDMFELPSSDVKELIVDRKYCEGHKGNIESQELKVA